MTKDEKRRCHDPFPAFNRQVSMPVAFRSCSVYVPNYITDSTVLASTFKNFKQYTLLLSMPVVSSVKVRREAWDRYSARIA